MSMVVIGRGWVGRKVFAELRRRGIEAKLLSHTRAADPFDWPSPPSFVINCAGVTGVPNVDACQADPIGTMLGNVAFAVRLATQCEERGIGFVHWSSGCIFSGGPHDEDSTPNFHGSVYSASKAAADIALRQHLVLRIRMPFDGSGHPKNLLAKLEHYARTGKLLDGLNSLSHVDEMVSLSIDLMLSGATGVQHLVNRDPISTREIIGMLVGRDVEWWDEADFAWQHPAQRSVCQLTTRLATRPVREALAEAIGEYRSRERLAA